MLTSQNQNAVSTRAGMFLRDRNKVPEELVTQTLYQAHLELGKFVSRLFPHFSRAGFGLVISEYSTNNKQEPSLRARRSQFD